MTVEEIISVLAMQEEILQFNHFTNEDAWALGTLLVAESKRLGVDTAVEIRLNNGYTVFKYAGNGTTLNNAVWMDKMFAAVRRMENSCLGGGFPVRVEEVGVVGAILVSNQSHFVNHDIIIKALSRYLHVDEVPRIRAL